MPYFALRRDLDLERFWERSKRRPFKKTICSKNTENLQYGKGGKDKRIRKLPNNRVNTFKDSSLRGWKWRGGKR